MKPLPFLIWHLLALALAAAACDGIHDGSAPGNLVPKTVDEDPPLPSLELAGDGRRQLPVPGVRFSDPAFPACSFPDGWA